MNHDVRPMRGTPEDILWLKDDCERAKRDHASEANIFQGLGIGAAAFGAIAAFGPLVYGASLAKNPDTRDSDGATKLLVTSGLSVSLGIAAVFLLAAANKRTRSVTDIHLELEASKSANENERIDALYKMERLCR